MSRYPLSTKLTARVVTHAFAASVIAFLLLGALVVLGQALLLAFGEATMARGWAKMVTPYVYGAASVSAMLAFALSYKRTHAMSET